MAFSNIKLFDENKGNMLTDTEFNISTQRLNGLQTGVASSQLQNKAMYQASLVAYAIAQVMMQNGLNANDTDAVSAFVANLSGTMLQKVYDIATTEEAKAGVATGKWMSPALVKTAINYMKATTAEAQAGTDDTKWMSPALVKAAVDKTLTDKNYLQKSGGTMTGNLTLNANPTTNLGAATKQYVDTAQSACLLKSGGTMTGNLILNANPSVNLGAATKQYVDTKVSAVTPVFGDLAKNGWFKLGNMEVVAHTASSFRFMYSNFYTFLSNNISNLSEIAIVIKNSTWQNSHGSMSYSITVSNNSSQVSLVYVGPSFTCTINRIARMPITDSSEFASGSSFTLTFGIASNSLLSFESSKKDLYIESNNKSYLKPTSIGTAEIWYR